MVGKHLIADVRNISNFEILNTVYGIKPLMEKIIQEVDLHVVGEVQKQFNPIGATCLYLLSESHLSAHSYPELRYLAIDLYNCSGSIDLPHTLDMIYNYSDGSC